MIYHGETTELNTVSVYTLEEDEQFQPAPPGHTSAHFSADISTSLSDQFRCSESERETSLSGHDQEEEGYILEQRLKIIGNSRNVNICGIFLVSGASQ